MVVTVISRCPEIHGGKRGGEKLEFGEDRNFMQKSDYLIEHILEKRLVFTLIYGINIPKN